jgi:hypothetical protein
MADKKKDKVKAAPDNEGTAEPQLNFVFIKIIINNITFEIWGSFSLWFSSGQPRRLSWTI